MAAETASLGDAEILKYPHRLMIESDCAWPIEYVGGGVKPDYVVAIQSQQHREGDANGAKPNDRYVVVPFA
jgi:hypothetical protein